MEVNAINEVAKVARATLDAVRLQASADHDILVRMEEKVVAVLSRFDAFEQNMKRHEEAEIELYVTKEQFKPVQMIAFGIVALIVLAVGGAIVAQVVVK